MTELVEQNLALVHHVVGRRWGAWRVRDPHRYEDMIAAGMHGLVCAARGFKPELGFKFSTYAFHAIERRVSHYLQRWLGKDGHRNHLLEADMARLSETDAPLTRSAGAASADVEPKVAAVRAAVFERLRAEIGPRKAEAALRLWFDQEDYLAVAHSLGKTRSALSVWLQGWPAKVRELIEDEVAREAIA